jgi:nitrate reductase NapAB chaperone NapD
MGWLRAYRRQRSKCVLEDHTLFIIYLMQVLHEELYLVRLTIIRMDASGDQSDEQQAAEKPIGIEEQRTIESQQAQAEISTEDVNELPATTTEEIIGKAQEQTKADVKQEINEKPKPQLKNPKLFDQFTKHFQVSKLAGDNTNNMLKQIQKQLTQMEKTNIIRNKQQVVMGQLVTQVKMMQKQLDKVSNSINRIKNISNTKGKGASSKRNRK